MKTGITDKKITVIPLGIPRLHRTDQLAYSLPFKILFVGRLVPENNPEHLVKLCGILNQQHEFQLTVVGDGPLKDILFGRLHKCCGESVQFLGSLYYNQLQLEYPAHHILIVTREAGATPRVAIEALSNKFASDRF